MSTYEVIIISGLSIFAILIIAVRQNWIPSGLGSRRFGAVMSSNRGLWMATTVAILSILCYLFWNNLTALNAEWVSPDFPMWGYVAIIVGLVILIGLFRMNKEQREKSVHMAEWLIGFTAIFGALIIFASWEKEDALCADKQAITSVPATGMVVELQSCWKEPFVVLDLRETGVTVLSFNTESASLRGRTVGDFAYLKTGYPGALDGHARLVFNSAEMRRYGMTSLPIFVGPSGNQPGATPRFDDATLEALSK